MDLIHDTDEYVYNDPNEEKESIGNDSAVDETNQKEDFVANEINQKEKLIADKINQKEKLIVCENHFKMDNNGVQGQKYYTNDKEIKKYRKSSIRS